MNPYYDDKWVFVALTIKHIIWEWERWMSEMVFSRHFVIWSFFTYLWVMDDDMKMKQTINLNYFEFGWILISHNLMAPRQHHQIGGNSFFTNFADNR